MRAMTEAPEITKTDVTAHVDIGTNSLTVENVVRLARRSARPVITDAARSRVRASAAVLNRLHADGEHVYGVTTSVGASVTTRVPPELSADLSLNLLRMHGCGTGRLLSDEESAAVLCVRLNSVARGRSGVREEVVQLLCDLLDRGVLPLIPSEGSVGASGDLTPLSYVAAVLAGEREVRLDGRELPAVEAMAAVGLHPVELGPKEALALMNGTSVASALGCLAWARARRLARLSARLTAIASRAIHGNPTHFDAYIHASKPHPGQIAVAEWIRADLQGGIAVREAAKLQDRYSIRCAPHVVGVLVDSLRQGREIIETEINGVSDNPIVDVERGIALHGGNFYGGHVAYAFDNLKTAVANLAGLMDRQMALLCNPAENEGLPANLVGVVGDGACTHNGLKAVTIATSALAAEALKQSIPASIFSRSTELHNQDKVPMATIAARDLLRIVELTEQVAAMLTIACMQAIDLRGGSSASDAAGELHRAVRKLVPKIGPDRRLDRDIRRLTEQIREGRLPVGDQALPA